jgi:dipeptidyl aminopeptidase/acylaminoacyl peptidase
MGGGLHGDRLKAALAALVCSAGLTAASLASAQVAPRTQAPAWAAPASTTADVEELTFHNGPTRLSGTLYLPPGDGRSPLVVVTHSASGATRDLPLYRHLIEMLPPLGVAVFVYDRRGSGKSGGDLADSDYDMLADDAIAAQRMLSRHPRIDGEKTGFWGLSQGGWLSLLAASRNPDTAFAISISAPMTTPDVQMIFAVSNILRIRGFSEQDIAEAVATRRAVDAYMRGETERSSAEQALAAAVDKPWFQYTYMNPTLGDPATSRWPREMRHDPLATLDRVKAPALIIYGSVDPWVPVAISTERLAAIAGSHPNLQTVVIAGADHEMMLTASEMEQIDPAEGTRHQPDSAAYLGLLAAWLVEQGFARPVPEAH